MIADFTDRRPALSAVLIALLFTLVPGAFVVAVELAFGGEADPMVAVVIYAAVLQVLLWCKVERPVLIMLPLIMAILGFIVSEIVYTVSLSRAPVGAGPSPLALIFSSALVILFGAEGAGSIGGLLVYGVIVIFKKLREVIACR